MHVESGIKLARVSLFIDQNSFSVNKARGSGKAKVSAWKEEGLDPKDVATIKCPQDGNKKQVTLPFPHVFLRICSFLPPISSLLPMLMNPQRKNRPDILVSPLNSLQSANLKSLTFSAGTLTTNLRFVTSCTSSTSTSTSSESLLLLLRASALPLFLLW
jgi:hypothetical protein